MGSLSELQSSHCYFHNFLISLFDKCRVTLININEFFLLVSNSPIWQMTKSTAFLFYMLTCFFMSICCECIMFCIRVKCIRLIEYKIFYVFLKEMGIKWFLNWIWNWPINLLQCISILFLIPGLETSSTAMSFLLLLVAIHPDVQNQLAEELEEIFGQDSTRTATSDDVTRMHVMDRVIKETLRHNPIATTLSREISEDVVLPSGYTLPKGCSTMVMSYAVHRNVEFFVEPHRWDEFSPLVFT